MRMTIRVIAIACAFAFACPLSVATFAAEAAARSTVPARDIGTPNTPERRPPATTRRGTGSVTQARGLQHPVHSNDEVLRSTLRAPAHGGGQKRAPTAGKAIARPHSASGNAPNSALVPPSNTGSPSANTASGRMTGTQSIAPNAFAASGRVLGAQPIAPSAFGASDRVSGAQPTAPSALAASGRMSGTSPIAPNAITANGRVTGSQPLATNVVPGNRRPPSGLTTLGGAVTNRNATRGVLDGNSLHRRF
jgi:hypothetical protein